jgi:8-oxo-dGTP pyrophosphatase MutT (NUDIX family)
VAARHPGEWIIHGERIVDDSRRAVLSIAEVELPDGVRFEQYVLRVPAAAIVAVVNEQERVLMMRRHRFVLDRWVWELPGGYLDPDEDPAVCAAREVEEETGWRPQPLLTIQPMVSTIDQDNRLYLAVSGCRPATGGPPSPSQANPLQRRHEHQGNHRDLRIPVALGPADSKPGDLLPHLRSRHADVDLRHSRTPPAIKGT